MEMELSLTTKLLLANIGVISAWFVGGVGSAFGCSIAGQSLMGVLKKKTDGMAKLVGMAAAPMSQAIYGFVFFIMNTGNINSEISTQMAITLFVAGIGVGFGNLFSAIGQGKVAAHAINASSEQPGAYGLGWAPIGVTETIGLFAMVFGILAVGAVEVTKAVG